MIDWIEKVLAPYVKSAPAILLMDFYASHTSASVLTHLKKYPNIHVGIIVGGTTSTCQPWDLTVNKEFKGICRQKSLEYTNRLIKTLNEMNFNFEGRPAVSDKITIIEGQTVIAQKDLKRQRKNKTTQVMLLNEMTPEDIYPWIKAAHFHICKNPDLVRKDFMTPGLIESDPLSSIEDGIVSGEGEVGIEDDWIPFEDEEVYDEEAHVNYGEGYNGYNEYHGDRDEDYEEIQYSFQETREDEAGNIERKLDMMEIE